MFENVTLKGQTIMIIFVDTKGNFTSPEDRMQ